MWGGLIALLATVVGAVILVMVGWLTWATPRFTRSSQVTTRELVETMPLNCPSNTVRASRPWGKAGWMAYCGKGGILHGPWIAAEGGRLVLRGNFEEGRPAGVLELYDEEGEVEKRVSYGTPSTEYPRQEERLPAEEQP